MDTLEKFAADNNLTQAQVDKIRQNVSDFMKCATQDPELLSDALEKLGFDLKPWGTALGNTAKGLATVALFAGAANAVGDVYETAKDSIQKSRNYKAMMDQNPELRDLDATKVQQSFNTLHRFNPQYAQDPVVAGEWVASNARRQGIDWTQLKNVVDASKSMRTSQPPLYRQLVSPEAIARHMILPGSPQELTQQSAEAKAEQAAQQHALKMEALEADAAAAYERQRRAEHFSRGIPGLEE